VGYTGSVGVAAVACSYGLGFCSGGASIWSECCPLSFFAVAAPAPLARDRGSQPIWSWGRGGGASFLGVHPRREQRRHCPVRVWLPSPYQPTATTARPALAV